MRSRSPGELPQLELECLAALWQPACGGRVGEVQAVVAAAGRPLAYTTVLTVMERLLRKQAVERRREGRGYIYRPRWTREELRERAVTRLVHNHFGTRQALRDYLQSGLQGAPPGMPASAPAVSAALPAALVTPAEETLLD